MNNNANTNNKPTQKKKNKKQVNRKNMQIQTAKRKNKLTRAQYEDLRQIEWVPFDPYAD